MLQEGRLKIGRLRRSPLEDDLDLDESSFKAKLEPSATRL